MPQSGVVTYRPEIDGLRALSVILVILFHWKILIESNPLVPNGFLGVDVFFVISGFLITLVLIQKKGLSLFSIGQFYLKRIFRILPLVLGYFTVSAVVSWLFLLPDPLIEVSSDSIAALFFYANYHFMSTVDYWRPEGGRWVLHFWSLGVEEQFYLLYPVLVYFILKWKRSFQILICLGLLLLSLFYFIHISGVSPEVAFYSFFARSWELIAGGALGFFCQVKPNLLKCKNRLFFLQALGIALIFWPSFSGAFQLGNWLLNVSVVTGACIILYYTGNSEKTFLENILQTKILVFIGKISFGLYLWHYLALSVASLLGYSSELYGNLILIISIVLLSVLTYYFIEQPFRKGFLGKRVGFSMALIFVWISSLALWFSFCIFSQGAPERFEFLGRLFESFERKDTNLLCSEKLFGKKVSIAERLFSTCRVGESKDYFDFIVYGDSHAEMYIPAIETIASEMNLAGLVVFVSGCPPVANVEFIPHYTSAKKKECATKYKDFLKFLTEMNVNHTFVVSRWNYFFNFSEKNMTLEVQRMLEDIKPLSGKIHVLGSIPEMPDDARKLYTRALFASKTSQIEVLNKKLSDQGVHKHIHVLREKRILTALLEYPQGLIQYVKMDHDFCKKGVCEVGNFEESFYSDNNHLSDGGIKRATPALRNYFDSIF